ncbi:MAG: DUF58 domain-containing protein [Thermus sp.]|uniref:DUF58 domain-containing protein n=1 Tax=Thermus sp. TaxID=275 RepID=UPI003D0B01B1
MGALALLLLLALALAPRWLRAKAQVHGFPPGFPGRTGEGRVEVEVQAPLPVLLRVEVGGSAALGLSPREVLALAWGRARLALSLPYRYRRRGAHALPTLHLRARGVLGLGERRLALPLGEALVYPALRPLPPLLPAPAFFLEGRRVPRGLPDPLEAVGLRPYRPGDPLRLLARKASLRLGRPVVREVERRLEGGLFLHLDAESLHPSYLDHAASLALGLLLEAERRGERYGLSAGAVLPLGRGKAHLRRALELLARLAPSPTPLLPPPAPWGSTYVLLTQAAEEAFLKAALRGARRAREGLLVLLPEGYFLFPGERGRPVHGKPPALERALRYRGLLAAGGVRLKVVRGHEPFGGK